MSTSLASFAAVCEAAVTFSAEVPAGQHRPSSDGGANGVGTPLFDELLNAYRAACIAEFPQIPAWPAA